MRRHGRLIALLLLLFAIVEFCLLASWHALSLPSFHHAPQSTPSSSSSSVASERRRNNNVAAVLDERRIPGVSRTSKNTKKENDLVVDIIVIGSHTRLEYMDGQERTIGAHPAVRHFVRYTEVNDTEQDCSTYLTRSDIEKIVKKCKRKQWNRKQHDLQYWNALRKHFFRMDQLDKKSDPVGWVCAQKRPIDALYHVLTSYDSSKADKFPDYLMLMDDDTWVNLPAVLQELAANFAPTEAHAVTGCMIRAPVPKLRRNLTFAWGGFSNIFTRPVLERFTTPIHCDNRPPIHNNHKNMSSTITGKDDFNTQVCARLQQNQMGERDLFQNGMTVNDLMYKYTFDQPYLNVSTWNSVGFCFHSDWIPSSFVNYYFLANSVRPNDLLTDRTAPYRDSIRYRGEQSRECKNVGDQSCHDDNHFCHNISPGHMARLHNSNRGK